MNEPPPASALGSRIRQFTESRVVRFGCVGVLVALFFAGLNALLGVLGLGPQAAFFLAYPPALALHFLLNKLWTFGDRSSTTRHQVGEYCFSVIVTFLVQWPSFLFFQKIMRLPGWSAAFGANLLQMSVSFALLRWRVFRHPSKGSASAPSNPWHRIAVLLVALGGVALIYWTAMGGWSAPKVTKAGGDYYNLLVSGFRKGSLAMDVPVPDALKTASNPWDPASRPAVNVLHDASYFNGRYYLYFGVVPAVLLFWPFHALTGYDLPFVVASVVFVAGAFLATSWVWIAMLRWHFPKASQFTKLAGMGVLGLCGGQLVLARRASIWEMPIGGGHFFLTILIVAAYSALRARKPERALAAAGLSLGLAIGCRPTLAAAGPALAYLVVITGWRGPGVRERVARLTKGLVAAALPFGTVVSALLAYNRARFGSLTEFGLNYQLTGENESTAQHFLLRFVPFNLKAYFIQPPQWGRYFPFIHPISTGTSPAGYYGMEFVYGALVVCPVILGVFLVAGLLRGRKGTAEARFGWFLVLLAVATTFVLASFNTAAARYEVDFLPWWLWLALLGWAWIEDLLAERTKSSQGARILFYGVFAVAAAFSLALTFLQSAALHSILITRNPAAYRSISRVFNYPVAVLERIAGRQSGPISMEVRFPDFPGAILQPLIVTGVEYESDYFFVYYKAPGVIRLGFANSGDPPVYSRDIRIESGRSYKLRFEGGALYPPSGHPEFAGWSEGQIGEMKNVLRMSIDGRIVLNQPMKFQEGAPGFLQVGEDSRHEAFGRRFTGVISGLRREPLARPLEPEWIPGDVVMRVTLPDEVVPGSQPLLVVGKTGRAELVGYRSTDAGHFVLSYEKWGGGYWESGPIAVPEGHEATFRIRLGSLLGGSGAFPRGLFSDKLIVWMDGEPVWWRLAFGDLGAEPKVEVLANFIGSSAMRSTFQGSLLALSREDVPEFAPRAFRTLEVDLVATGSDVEPLVVTGVPGQADLLAIEWLPGNRARFILDHWGHSGFLSPAFSWAPEQMHHLVLTLPSFGALGSVAGPADEGLATAEVDGQPVWRERVAYYRAAAGTLAFGKNTVGSSVAVPALKCTLGDVRQDFDLR